MSRWAAAAFLVLGIALALTPLSPAAPRGGTFRVAEPAQYIDSIDGALTESAGDTPWLSTACASLMHVKDQALPGGFRIAPELAAGFPKISADKKTYVFTIRKGARFNTGAPVTAKDVAFTLNRLLSKTLKSPAAGSFQPIVGAQEVLDGKAAAASGIVASGRTLTIRLTRPVGDFSERASFLCVLPSDLPIGAAGVQAPVPSAAPYYVSEFVPSERLVLERNSFYRGPRPQHVDRFVFDLTVDDEKAIEEVVNGSVDYAWVPNDFYAKRVSGLARRFGVNRSRFFVEPSLFLRMFVLNTSRPLLRDNTPLRQAINNAVERTALLLRFGGGRVAGTPVDQFVPPIMPGFTNAHLYPLVEPNIVKARALAKGNTRSGKLVLYVPARAGMSALAQIVKRDLARIGLTVEIDSFPLPLYFQKLATRTEPFDMAYVGWLFDAPDPGEVLDPLFDGGLIGTPSNSNYSYFDSPTWNRALRQASQLTGDARNRAYGRLDVRLARDAAPAVAFGVDNALTLVSARTGCVVVNPYLDLSAVCLK